MAFKIRSGFWLSSYLKVDPKGVKFYDRAAWGGARRYRFADVRNVLLSRTGVLSFQVNSKVCSIQTKSDNPKHQRTIYAFQEWLRATKPQ